MANWLLDYIEMTEYIPVEFRNQSFSLRELDLTVSNKMSKLDGEIKIFFENINKLSPQEKQEQYEALIKKCEEATQTASDKIKLADRLHDLVEKSMRILDQGLEKLKEDLIEGDKGYIVEDIERRSREEDQQLKAEEELMLQRHQASNKAARGSKSSHSKNHITANNNHLSNHRHSLPSNHNNSHHNHNNSANQVHNRSRNNSTGTQSTISGPKPKKRERKRLNSALTIFNRNSATRTDDDSTNQTFLSSPSTPDYLVGLHNSNSNSLNDLSSGDHNSHILKGMISGNRNAIIGSADKNNGNDKMLAKARQPILTAIDAAHAVSPNATNSDRLVLFSGQANGDSHKDSNHIRLNAALNNQHMNSDKHHLHSQSTYNHTSHTNHQLQTPSMMHNMGHHTPGGLTGIDGEQSCSSAISSRFGVDKKGSNFGSLPLASRHDPIMMAASQAINATQSMTSGRRTSSLKASYAAVNSGRIRHLPSAPNQAVFDQSTLTGEVYCKCRGTKHDPNMIACDNDDCKFEWFHYECVGITTPPDGEWYCEDCRISMGYKLGINKQLKKMIETPNPLPSSMTSPPTPTPANDTTATTTTATTTTTTTA